MTKKSSESPVSLVEPALDAGKRAPQACDVAMIDAAVAKGVGGRSALSETLHASFDLIQQAFGHYEAGRDDDARNALQGVGLQSPFLEWKLLLRGLIAYQASDDARALDNWQRLAPARLPHRLCAALRAAIHPEFMQAQPARVQQALAATFLRHQGAAIAPVLRKLRDQLHQENLAPAFHTAQDLLPTLRKDHPHLVARLATVFAWAIVHNGHPKDLDRYLRTFGGRPDDPKLDRLRALALEARGILSAAHASWQSFIKHLETAPAPWPGEIAKRAQAIIWARMAENASAARTPSGHAGNPFLGLLAAHQPLKPGAEQCFEKSIKLWPEQVGAYRELIRLYADDGKADKARKVAAQLLKHHPNDAQTLEQMASLHVAERDYVNALKYLERAIQANPLDRTLQTMHGVACQHRARELILEREFEQARAHLEFALKRVPGVRITLLCRFAMCEMKAGNAGRADELIREALEAPSQRLACKFALVGESIRAKLPAKEKKQIVADFKAALADAPTPAETLKLIDCAAHQRVAGEVPFAGQKAYEKTMFRLLDEADFTLLDEQQVEWLVRDLETLDAGKRWLRYAMAARRRFLKNPYFRLSLAEYYLLDRTDLAREHLDDARRLVQDLPAGEAQQRLLDEIREKDEAIADAAGAQFDVFDQFFGGFAR